MFVATPDSVRFPRAHAQRYRAAPVLTLRGRGNRPARRSAGLTRDSPNQLGLIELHEFYHTRVSGSRRECG